MNMRTRRVGPWRCKRCRRECIGAAKYLRNKNGPYCKECLEIVKEESNEGQQRTRT